MGPSQTDTSEPDTRRSRMGERLRALRQDKGLTLQQLADRTGISIGTLSKVERGLTSLGYDRFERLALGMDVDMAALFSEGNTIAKGAVATARRGDVTPHSTENYDLGFLFSEVWGKTMTPVIAVHRADRPMNLDTWMRHPGQEFVFVLDGVLELLFENRTPLHLEAGESAYFDSSSGHLYTCGGDDQVTVLVVCSAPQETLIDQLEDRRSD
ncbi:XRE family transcriptional regulator [Seohaeicola saemankumensis]|uniref:helix-turn-helix domain-containing protein n=1 Tax=Seohaeicola saemankumensis TaxID=481181 RepID=UPI0035CED617